MDQKRRIRRIIRKKGWIIVGSIALAIGLGVAFVLYPTYRPVEYAFLLYLVVVLLIRFLRPTRPH